MAFACRVYDRIILTALLVVIFLMPDCKAAEIIDLGPFYGNSFGFGVSTEGNVAVGYGNTLNGDRAFRWTSTGGMFDLGLLPGGTGGNAFDVSSDGSVVVGMSANRAFRWTDSGAMTDLGTLFGGLKSYGYGVSADGSIVAGSSESSSGYRAFRWSASSGMQNLGVLPGGSISEGYDISADGSVVVGYSTTPTGNRAFRWTASDGMKDLGTLTGGSSSVGNGVSADGTVVVGDSNNHAFRWTASSGMLDLGLLPGSLSSYALAADSDGTVVIGSSYSNSYGNKAFIWDSFSKQMQDLKAILTIKGTTGISDWLNLNEATAITKNSAGEYNIIGTGNFGGHTHAFVVRGLSAVPEPSTYALGLIASGLLALLVRRKTNWS